MYCVPSTSKETGMPMMPELVFCSQSSNFHFAFIRTFWRVGHQRNSRL
jgi:hypothetical protein